MTKVGMAVFDLDGTLLEHGALTGEAIRMLLALRRNGVTVTIATGRHRGTVPLRLHSPLLVDYLICSNGAVVTPAKGVPLFEKTIDREELQGLMALGKAQGCRYTVNVDRATFLSRTEPMRRRRTDGGSDTKKYFWRYYMYPLHSHIVESWDAYLQSSDAKAEKVICVADDPGSESIFDDLVAADGRFTVTASNQATEITARGVSKGSALRFLAVHLNMPREAIVAFGNDDNDLSLREGAGRFVAARVSSPAALQAADEVADSIPQAALRLCLGERKGAVKP